ncbi:MAG: DEAD/DEAH box helicase family protein [Methanobrevibacter sp.]|jgi:superfamily II DNA or RNA helicase|nr:DEAD/DEAH box helicase family protein [Candidatus Methanoflexus mossambicus]
MKILYNWATGTGKSKKAIDHIKEITNNDIHKKILLVVAEVAHKKNWKEEFNKWELNPFINITIECYASLKKYINTNWDLIIFDEAHHLQSENRIDIIATIKSNDIILLTATIDKITLQNIEMIYGKFTINKYSLNNAIKNNRLPEPKIFLIKLLLNNQNKTETYVVKFGQKETIKTYQLNSFDEFWHFKKNKKQYNNCEFHIKCTEQEQYDYLTNEIKYWKNNYMIGRQEYQKNKWLRLELDRKIILGNMKTKYVEIFLNKIKNKKRFICFCSSIEQSMYFSSENSINSKKNDSLKIIDNFNNKKINSIFAVKMLQEGQNLVDIDYGIIIQLDSKERLFIQKFGRTLRSILPEQYIFYFENTQDEKYMQNIINNIDAKYIFFREWKYK